MTSDLEEENRVAELTSHLPGLDRATSLVECFYGNVAWLVCPIEREEIVQDILPVFYPGRRPLSPRLAQSAKAHELALLLIVLACGAAGDHTQPPTNAEGEKYFQLARAALAVGNMLQDTSLASVQATMLVSKYMLISGRKANPEEAYRIFSVTCNLAMSVRFLSQLPNVATDICRPDWSP